MSIYTRPNERNADSPAGLHRQPGRQQANRPPKNRAASWWWAAPAVFLVFAFHYLGVGAGSFYAFTDWKGIGPFKVIGLENFTKIFSSEKNRLGLINTFVIAGLFLVLTNVLGLLFALGLNRQLKSRNFLRALLFAPVVLSPLAVSYIWKFIFDQNGPLNAALASAGLEDLRTAWLGNPATALGTIVTVMVWQHIGLAMVIYLAGLANIPAELEEAAAVDGATTWRRLRYIVLPLLRPTVVVASTLILIQGLKVFDQVQALTGGGPFGATETLATLVYKETFVNGKYGYGSALSLVLSLIVLIFALLQILLLRRKEV